LAGSDQSKLSQKQWFFASRQKKFQEKRQKKEQQDSNLKNAIEFCSKNSLGVDHKIFLQRLAATLESRKILWKHFGSEFQAKDRFALYSERQAIFNLAGVKFCPKRQDIGLKYPVLFVGGAEFQSSLKKKKK
jgi:hypothetical protein